MSTSLTQVVRPISHRAEAFFLLLLAGFLVGVLALYIRDFGVEESAEEIYAWQISSFNSFEGADQSIYNALFTAKDEIPYIYDDINAYNEPGVKFHWPTLEELQWYYLPPFHHDTSWEQNGSLQWSLYEPKAEGEMQGYTLYLGTNGTHSDQGSFLLTIGHVHAGFQNNNAMEIWWHPQNSVEMPGSGFKDSLIRDGWKYVVPYSGDKEVKRIYGD